MGRIRDGQDVEEGEGPRGWRAEAVADPVAFGVGRAARVRFRESRVVETSGEGPKELVGGDLIRVEHLDDHRAAGTECLETGKGLRCEESLNGVLLTVVVRAEIEAAVGRVEVRADVA